MKPHKYLAAAAVCVLATSSLAAPKKPAVIVAQGQIREITRPPKPGASPYRDAIIAIRLSGVKAVSGKVAGKEILIFAWGMRDNKWTGAAKYRVGQTVRLSLRPWDAVANKYGGYNRIELEGEDVYDLEPYWGEAVAARKPR